MRVAAYSEWPFVCFEPMKENGREYLGHSARPYICVHKLKKKTLVKAESHASA